ncbi:Acriflavin resistance protein [uncultured Gammaproteobacteria bacterium]
MNQAHKRRSSINISAWSILNPVPPTVLFVMLTLAGIYCFQILRVNQMPDIDVPAVIVTITQSGAAPAEMEVQITRKIEDSAASLGNVDHIRSTISDGVSTTAIEFALGVNTDRAVNDVRDAVSKIRQTLPQDINEPVISRVDFIGGAMATYVVEAPNLALEALSWFIDNEVSRALLSVKGVSQIQRSGGADREVRIELVPDRLNALGVTADEVNQQLRALNVNLPGGRGMVGGAEQTIRTLGSAATLEQLRATPIILSGGRTARLQDLGRVIDGAAEQRQLARFNGKEVVAFSVLRAVGSGEVAVAKAVEAKVESLRTTYSFATFTLVNSTTRFVKGAYDAAMEALLLGAGLAVLVVLVFLRDWRATLISAAAMPLSLLPTFAVMQGLGFTINTVTLLGLTLVVGILVDDAIVEVENIVRHIHMGKSPMQAAFEAADEIGLAVIATTMVIVVVFLPVSFMPGIPGQFFRQFGISVAAAVLFSLAVARLLTPMMCAFFLKTPPEEPPEGRFTRFYRSILVWCLDHRIIATVAAFGIFAGTMVLAPLIPSGFVPVEDRSQTLLTLELSPGATLAETDRIVAEATRLLRAEPEVVSVVAGIGVPSQSGFGQSSLGEVRKATLTVNLKPKAERAISQKQFELAAGKLIRQIPGIRFSFAKVNGGKDVTIILAGDDPAVLMPAAEKVFDAMRALAMLADVNSGATLLRPEIQIRPNFERAADLGVSVQRLATLVKVTTLGDVDAALAKFTLADRQIPIRVQLDPAARANLDVIGALRVSRAGGGSVPLSSVAETRVGSGTAQINRFDRARQVTIEANLNGAALGQALAAIQALPEVVHLPPGVRLLPSGDAEHMAELNASFGIAILTGVMLVLAVLVILFGGVFQPITIMMALPLSLGGALLALLITGDALGIAPLIGILMLMGIVGKNSILLVDYALSEIELGSDRRHALLEAGAKRSRPIVMTTIAMVAGMLPIAARLGEDADFRAPMAVAVIGGLIASTLLSLVFIPVMFTFMDDLSRLFRRLVG